MRPGHAALHRAGSRIVTIIAARPSPRTRVRRTRNAACRAALHTAPPTIESVFQALSSLMLPAVLDRALLVLNHVVAAEPAASARLRQHAGRSLRVEWDGVAGPLPLPPPLMLRITPAGLFERPEAGADAAGGLRLVVELPPPHEALLGWLSGARPRMHVEGDAQVAADIAWLAEHLRWDAEADLARLVGDAPAHELARWGRALRGALAAVAQRASSGSSRRDAGSAPASR